MDEIEPIKINNVSLRQNNRTVATGVLKFQHAVMLFHDAASGTEQWIEYMIIQTVDMVKLGPTWILNIFCKNFRKIEFQMTSEDDCLRAHDRLQELSLPEDLEQLDAFRPQRKIDSDVDGWALYSPMAEYGRMGVPNPQWQQVDYNNTYNLCPTYGRTLYLPSSVTMEQAFASAKFRSKQRLPVLSYLFQRNQAAICRCAQPLTGVQAKRSEDDEALLEFIRLCNPHSELPLIIVDTRPRMNAMANKAAGKGFENMEGYTNCRLEFHGIENIHTMRGSLNALVKVVQDPTISMSKYLKGIQECAWLKHIQAVLKTTMVITRYIQDGHSVLVHCSDGWDRTAQTCSLAGLMLDPYYRTIEGYIVLIEKEWLSFGHKFLDRNGFLKGSGREVSPIFLQLLECTWCLQRQFPLAFEFNESFLIAMHDCLHSCKFGTFLGNCEQARRDAKLHERTQSAWSYLYSRKSEFINPFYDASQDPEGGVLNPSLAPQHFELWSAMYCRWESASLPRQPLLRSFEYYKVKLDHDKRRLAEAKARLSPAAASTETNPSTEDPIPSPLEPLQTWLDNSTSSIMQSW